MVHYEDDLLNLPDVSDVSFPAMAGAIPPKRKRKRKPVTYHGVKLSRRPMKFEAKVLSLTEIPPRLDAAVATLQKPDTPLMGTLQEMARFGSQQVLLELVRQGAPDTILATLPDCADAVRALAETVQSDRALDVDRAWAQATVKLSTRRISEYRRRTISRELADKWTPGIVTRHAKRAVNEAFALGRAAVIDEYRRPRLPTHLAYHDWEYGAFISKAEAMAQGQIIVDAVIQTAVMDTNTCEECEDVDGEVMDLGEERQEELHPPYVKCPGRDRC